MLRVLLFLVPLALAIYALVDCISSEDEEVRHLPKLVWIVLIVFAPVVGALTWILIGRERSLTARRRSGGWVAPDDNPEFLRSLDQNRLRGQDGGPEDADEDGRRDKELLESWEEDLRRREEELRQQNRDEDEPPGGKG
ncbi:PLD nuclease N-terminal domain-containing protein [Streptomyces hoynatensis]|uniref:PLDc_N domain-containing protein n=1 Tax=Streptomyces hoynatensis TaxID=1141874 RepID=A0A3A9Z3E4_9ACTN|nr:PLD nuclease N-terminal domain-containing protein [Streptomyces hoynatensis]RKN41847.1 PLDc_N domain-containing protein [Streptomyces hoynatensis]